MSDKILYSKYSNDRAVEYCISTDIIQMNTGKIVRKKAMSKSSEVHIENLTASEKALSAVLDGTKFKLNKIVCKEPQYVDLEYIDGKSFDLILDEIYETKGYKALIEHIRLFFKEIDALGKEEFNKNELFERYFGECEFEAHTHSLSVADIDLVFQNVIVDKDDRWNVIDYEWTINCDIPVDFIKYRAIKLYVYGLSKRQPLIEKNLFTVFGINADAIAVYEKMEKHFQKVIKGEHHQLGDYYFEFGAPAFVAQKEFIKNEGKIIDVYFDKGNGFAESLKKQYTSFPLCIKIENDVVGVRIDPMRGKGIVTVEKIVDQAGNKLQCISNGESYLDRYYFFETEDPYLIITSDLSGIQQILVDIKVDFDTESSIPLFNTIKQEKEDLEEKYTKLCNDHAVLNEAHDASGNHINNLNAQIDNLSTQIGYLNTLIMHMENSLSWRMTKPIRGFKNSIKDVTAKNKMLKLGWKGIHSLRRNGLKETVKKVNRKIKNVPEITNYDYHDLDESSIAEQKNTTFVYMPKISILVPLYNTPDVFLIEMIESVRNQTYGNWQLCLADGSDAEHYEVEKRCKYYSKIDSRVVYKKLKVNGGISENTNACLQLADGEYIGLFDHDDLLTPDCLFEVVKRINEKENVDVVYTDEDKLLYDPSKTNSDFVEPHFKSHFNLDLFRTNNYICHFFVVRKSIVDTVGGFRSEYDGSQDYDFIFRCVEQARNIEHISKILYHWRIHANSTAANPQSKMYCYDAGKRAIESHLKRVGVTADVEMTEHLGFYRVKYPVKGNPLVSIIIPNKDEHDTLKKCIDSILLKSTYDNYEIIIVENNSVTDEIFAYYGELKNNSKIKVVYWKEGFNYSKINNFGVSQANGEYLLLLNNDVEVLTENWIEEMLSNCQREEVGITGAKLIYPDNTVQHCGVIMGLGGIAGHAFVGLDANHPGYFGRAVIQQDLSAVTAACLMVRRDVYDKVHGLEETLTVAFNDVDFCLKVRKAGYLVVMNPNVRLYHYESKSRGAEDTPEKLERFKRECSYMAKNWRDILIEGDPYYNPNLTLIRGDFSPAAKDENPPRYV